MSPAVPTEDELVEIGLQVPAEEAVIDAERQPLEVGEDPMDLWQQHVRRPRADRLRQMLPAFHALLVFALNSAKAVSPAPRPAKRRRQPWNETA
jgi:hypothetical protein